MHAFPKLMLFVLSLLFFNGYALALDVKNLVCIANEVNGTQHSDKRQRFSLTANDFPKGGIRKINNNQLKHSMPNKGSFCACNNEIEKTYFVANYTKWDSGTLINFNGWGLVNLGDNIPFLIGAEIEHANGFQKVPTAVSYEKNPVQCNNKQKHTNTSHTLGKKYNFKTNRRVRLTLFSKNGRTIEPGRYNITNLPSINSYRMLSEKNNVSKESMPLIPETIFKLNQDIRVHEFCHFQNNRNPYVQLGEIDYKSLNQSQPNKKPKGYNPIAVNIAIECNSRTAGHANVTFFDSNDKGSHQRYLSTNLDGVGVQLKFSSPLNQYKDKTIKMGTSYKKAINLLNTGQGQLSFIAYPVKTSKKGSNIALGEYKATATVIIEKH